MAARMEDVMPLPRDEISWVSYSSLGKLRECRQKFAYGYLLGLSALPRPDDAKVELNFGIWWHALRAADSIERGREKGSLLWEPRSLGLPDGAPDVEVRAQPERTELTDYVLGEALIWWDRLPEEHKVLWVQKLGEPLVDRLVALDLRWRDEYAEELPYEEPLVVEAKWVRELPGTGKEAIGYVDEVYRDTKRNVVVALDRKTAKQLDSMNSSDDMMDSQLHLYAWGLAPQLKERGVKINAVGYDRVRSVRATTPRLTQAGALSKQVTQFDLRSYLEWVAEGQEYPGRAKDGSGAGVYEADPAVVEHLSTPAWRALWFQRTRVPLNRNVIRAHLQAAVDTAKDLDVVVERFNRRGEASREFTSANCRWCDFAKLCRAQMMGGPDGEYPLGDFGLTGPKQ